MSGIFRSNSTTSHTNDSTPNKRFSFSAFCTSPGTLQDVTMENPYGVGYRSPCVSMQPFQGSTSPAGQGRSVREFEEQMATLRKENFNLKLRLYFMEESIPGYQQTNNSTDGQETLMRQIIDSKVEIEILRKDLQERQDLLKDAAHAMTQMEKIQKDTELKCQEKLDELQQKIQYLEMEREMMTTASRVEVLNDFQGLAVPEDITNFTQKIHELEDMLAKREETIKEYEDKVKELVFQNSELLESMENKDMEIGNKDHSIQTLKSAKKNLKTENEKLSNDLKSTQEHFLHEILSIKSYERQMRQQQETLSKMQVQQLRQDLQKCKMEKADIMCEVQDLEEKLQSREEQYGNSQLKIQELEEKLESFEEQYAKACIANQQQKLVMQKQQSEIKRLKNNSQTTNTTNNNEEKTISPSVLENTGLGRSLSDTEANNDLTTSQRHKYEALVEQQETTILALKAENKKKTSDLQNLVNKELWEKNREIERLNKILNKSNISTTLSTKDDGDSQVQQSFSEANYVSKNKLLQRKVDVLLKRLDSERKSDAVITQLRTELKQARASAETAEKWRRQCVDLCAVLSTRLEEMAGFLNSLLKHKDVLGVLAVEKRKAMRKAVDRSLDLSKSLNMTLSVSGLSMIDHSLAELHNLSDILGDAEVGLANITFNSHEVLPDNNQPSLELLKAENRALKKELDKRRSVDKKERRSLPLTVMVENRESESEAWSEPDRQVSLARIGLEDHSASLKAAKEPAALQLAETDSDFSESALLDGRVNKSRNQERISQLEQIVQQRDNRISALQGQVAEADERLQNENRRVEEITEELDELRKRNTELHDDLVAIGSQEPSNIHNESNLMQQIEQKTRVLEKLQEENERLVVESRLAEMQIIALKDDMDNMKRMHEAALQRADETEKQKLVLLRQEIESNMERSLQAHQQTFEECKKQLSDLQRQYVEAQRCIDSLQENEQELKQTLVESELATRNLQKQIDESTMRASKATMERVKALNDKLQVEKRLDELTNQLHGYQTEREEFQQQIQCLENEQTQLMGRLAVAQEAITQAQLAAVKNAAEICQSGYTSEEVPLPSATALIGTVAQQRLGEQRIHNSSPDLGIESDAGRVSSVELSSAQRSLLKTVEVNANQVDGKDGEEPLDSSLENIKPSNVSNAAVDQDNKKHDCVKVDQENAELRRKLLRTKRAFEDTYEKLRNANQRKAQIEKDIKNQILKTHNVLKNVRSNMENEL